jgi:predicted lipoprotein with Yx(FWY)xxD motif
MMQESIKVIAKILGMLMVYSIIIAMVSCDESGNNMGPIMDGHVSIAANSTLGDILVDGNGKTLYIFSLDVDGQSSCLDGTCLNNWPVFYTDELDPDPALDPGDFATIVRSDGEKQVTYMGWPLYYYVGDANKSDAKGDGVNNVWFAAKPDYSLMVASGQLVGADGKSYTGDYNEGEGNTMYFTDSHGRCLYIFTNDEKDTNHFTQSDFSNNAVWPIFYVNIDQLPSSMNMADFGEIDVFGEPQLTFRGWPVYYYGDDSQRGDTKGVSFPVPGIWPIINSETDPAQ